MKSLLVALLLCSATLAADSALAVAPADAACGPDNVTFDVKTDWGKQVQPEPGQALVFVVADYDKSATGDITPTVRIGRDGAWVGANRGNSHLFFPVEAGEHHLCADWKSGIPWIGRKMSLNSFSAEPGRTYYFRARIAGLGGWVLDRDKVNADEGRLLVEKSPLSDYRRKK
jgi:hypothetical protein